MGMILDVMITKNIFRQVARVLMIGRMDQWDLQGTIAVTVPRLTSNPL
jgi:hypothetical protein